MKGQLNQVSFAGIRSSLRFSIGRDDGYLLEALFCKYNTRLGTYVWRTIAQ